MRRMIKFLMRYRGLRRLPGNDISDNLKDGQYWYHRQAGFGKKYAIFRMSISFGQGYLIPSMIESFMWADEMGFIPIVLWSDTESLVSDLSDSKIDNQWEAFYEQDPEYLAGDFVFVGGMNAVYTSESVRRKLYYTKKERGYMELEDREWRSIFARYYSYYKEFFRLNPKLLEEMNTEWSMIKSPQDKILAVFMREEFSIDRSLLPPDDALNKHPWVKDVEESLDHVDEVIKRTGCNKVFVATVFEDTISAFVDRFGPDRVVFISRNRDIFAEYREFRIGYYAGKDALDADDADTDGKLHFDLRSHIDYFKEIYFCSKCDCLTGHQCSGTRLSLIMNGGVYDDYSMIPNHETVNLKV